MGNKDSLKKELYPGEYHQTGDGSEVSFAQQRGAHSEGLCAPCILRSRPFTHQQAWS